MVSLIQKGFLQSKSLRNGSFRLLSRASDLMKEVETLQISEVKPFVYSVALNRPSKMNAMNDKMWNELGMTFQVLGDDPDCRSIVLSGNGKSFTAGIDIKDLGQLTSIYQSDDDASRKAKFFYKLIVKYQEAITSVEKCNKPVICAIHNACIGGGVDLASTTDIRYCTKDAYFCVKEVELGLAADVGTLQRLPKIVGNDSLVRELCYTARNMQSTEALSCGFVNKVLDDHDSLMKEAISIASTIAEKSPVAVQGTKVNLIYARDHSVDQSLEFQAHWNSCMLQSEDLLSAMMAQMSKTTPDFKKF